MPNYFTEDIEAFKAEKRSEQSGTRRKTPSKQPKVTSQYSFTAPNGKDNQKFTYGHTVNTEGRVCLEHYYGDESPKLTLANDSCADQELAKTTLLRWLASPDGQDSLEIVRANTPTGRGLRKLTAVIKESLATLFDVGRDLITDTTWGPWDLGYFRSTALAYATVFGEGTSDSAVLLFLLLLSQRNLTCH